MKNKKSSHYRPPKKNQKLKFFIVSILGLTSTLFAFNNCGEGFNSASFERLSSTFSDGEQIITTGPGLTPTPMHYSGRVDKLRLSGKNIETEGYVCAPGNPGSLEVRIVRSWLQPSDQSNTGYITNVKKGLVQTADLEYLGIDAVSRCPANGNKKYGFSFLAPEDSFLISQENRKTVKDEIFFIEVLVDGVAVGTANNPYASRLAGKTYKPGTLEGFYKVASQNNKVYYFWENFYCLDFDPEIIVDLAELSTVDFSSSLNQAPCPAQVADASVGNSSFELSGGWGEWSQPIDSGCIDTKGSMIIQRFCDSPPPSNGGEGCQGVAQKKIDPYSCEQGEKLPYLIGRQYALYDPSQKTYLPPIFRYLGKNKICRVENPSLFNENTINLGATTTDLNFFLNQVNPLPGQGHICPGTEDPHAFNFVTGKLYTKGNFESPVYFFQGSRFCRKANEQNNSAVVKLSDTSFAYMVRRHFIGQSEELVEDCTDDSIEVQPTASGYNFIVGRQYTQGEFKSSVFQFNGGNSFCRKKSQITEVIKLSDVDFSYLIQKSGKLQSQIADCSSDTSSPSPDLNSNFEINKLYTKGNFQGKVFKYRGGSHLCRVVVIDVSLDQIIKLSEQSYQQLVATSGVSENQVASCPFRGTGVDEVIGSGTSISAVTSVVSSPSGESVYLFDRKALSVYKVSASSGNRTLISSQSKGTGPHLINPHGIAVDSKNKFLYLIDSGLRAIVRIDIQTGDRTIASGQYQQSVPGSAAVGTGSFRFQPGRFILMGPQDKYLYATGSIQVTSSSSAQNTLIRVEVDSGNRNIVAPTLNGTGYRFEYARSIGFNSDKTAVYFTDKSKIGIIDLITKKSKVLVTADQNPFQLFNPNSITLSPGNVGEVLVLSPFQSGVIAVTIINGQRRMFSGKSRLTGEVVGVGPTYESVQVMATLAGGRDAIMFDSKSKSLVKVSLINGYRSVVSKWK